MSTNVINIIILMSVAFTLNLPLGYIRGPVKKYTFKWFLYIHLAIPLIFLLRRYFGLGVEMIPVNITLSVIGQIIGGKIYKKRLKKGEA